ncbi:MAG TPA: 2-C-methyl-D-erythritol 2,4-cyclodiphosphate synthase [Nitrospinota bacterium]|nr:2-C-methyl-D-erythritol 2,4-cyclodiphosphate synthase [Nitrospinota bacterium]
MRIGIGYDVHRLVDGRKLVLGGVVIPYEKGLLGHSDADTLLHSICDAILGALCEGDIGKHFPDDNPEYKDIPSLELLKEVAQIMRSKGFMINNIDSIVVAQRPKINSYVPEIKQNIGNILDIDIDKINIKATTTEGLGFIGKGEGISAYSVVSLIEI